MFMQVHSFNYHLITSTFRHNINKLIKYAQCIYVSKTLKICFLASKFRKKLAKNYSLPPGQFFKKMLAFLDNQISIQKPKNIPSSIKTQLGDIIQSY